MTPRNQSQSNNKRELARHQLMSLNITDENCVLLQTIMDLFAINQLSQSKTCPEMLRLVLGATSVYFSEVLFQNLFSLSYKTITRRSYCSCGIRSKNEFSFEGLY